MDPSKTSTHHPLPPFLAFPFPCRREIGGCLDGATLSRSAASSKLATNRLLTYTKPKRESATVVHCNGSVAQVDGELRLTRQWVQDKSWEVGATRAINYRHLSTGSLESPQQIKCLRCQCRWTRGCLMCLLRKRVRACPPPFSFSFIAFSFVRAIVVCY